MTRAEKLAENLSLVRGKIADAARRSGRAVNDVTLVAVTKYVSADVARELLAAGCTELGESRPQELWAKSETLSSTGTESAKQVAAGQRPFHWHLIGHLQRNKVERTLPLVSLIHSGDSLRLLQAVENAAASQNRQSRVLLEVNISGDAAKHGFKPDELEPLLPELASFRSLEICGLMAMASREGDLSQTRREFAALRKLRNRLQKSALDNIHLPELSMGMSGDFEIAIEEGATLVRVGSALFEGVETVH